MTSTTNSENGSKSVQSLQVQHDELKAVLTVFGNVAEYSDIVEGMANVLRPHERPGFIKALEDAKRLTRDPRQGSSW